MLALRLLFYCSCELYKKGECSLPAVPRRRIEASLGSVRYFRAGRRRVPPAG